MRYRQGLTRTQSLHASLGHHIILALVTDPRSKSIRRLGLAAAAYIGNGECTCESALSQPLLAQRKQAAPQADREQEERNPQPGTHGLRAPSGDQ